MLVSRRHLLWKHFLFEGDSCPRHIRSYYRKVTKHFFVIVNETRHVARGAHVHVRLLLSSKRILQRLIVTVRETRKINHRIVGGGLILYIGRDVVLKHVQVLQSLDADCSEVYFDLR